MFRVSLSSISRLCLVLALCVHLAGVSGTISKSDKTKSKSKLNVKTGKIDKTVFDRDLVTQDEPSSKSILMESGAYYQDTALRNFNGTVLGYVTPVNQFLHSLLPAFF